MNDNNENKINFIPSQKWIGSKPGMIFKKGRKGLGYYTDKINNNEIIDLTKD